MNYKTLAGTSTLLIALLNGCGGGGGSADTSAEVTISGTITYDRIMPQSDRIGLDYSNIIVKNARNITVQAVDSGGSTIATATTDENGKYSMAVPTNTPVTIRALAMSAQKQGTPSWLVRVVDNTDSGALYAITGSLVSTGASDSVRDLHAPSGWDGSSYSSSRIAAPFAILDTVRESMDKVLGANPQTVFPDLTVNWSVNNVSASGDLEQGQIVTTHYNGQDSIYVLGDADSDTDEYDSYVIAHEWGHYYEDKLGQSNSIGGLHNSGDLLDIRVAFSEGFCNAFSAMVHENPLYFDTMGYQQSNGFFFSLEDETPYHPGWYSEGSVGRLFYDIYDSGSSETFDKLSLGFDAVHSVFTGPLKSTGAFVSIFPYITYLKDLYPAYATEIDELLSSENIAPINDIYGTGRSNLSAEEPYFSMNVGESINVCVTTTYGTYNKLGNHKYIRFTSPGSGTYKAVATKTSGPASDPDIYLYTSAPTVLQTGFESSNIDTEVAQFSIGSGEYLLDISEYNGVDACFDITLSVI